MSSLPQAHNLPEAASVGELCQMLGLSRRRFYELQKVGVFPQPSAYLVTSRRPIYLSDAIRTCLEVRRRNVGVNGQIVLFYASRATAAPSSSARSRRDNPPASSTRARRARSARSSSASETGLSSQHGDILDGLAALGVSPTESAVGLAITELFPAGTDGTDDGEVIRRLYQHLRARNPVNNVQR